MREPEPERIKTNASMVRAGEYISPKFFREYKRKGRISAEEKRDSYFNALQDSIKIYQRLGKRVRLCTPKIYSQINTQLEELENSMVNASEGDLMNYDFMHEKLLEIGFFEEFEAYKKTI
jgi:hypothetical protein